MKDTSMSKIDSTRRCRSTAFLLRAWAVLSVALACGSTVAAADSPAQPEAGSAIHYTWHEYRIPMRDGALLYTAVLSPDDTTRTYPMLMERTPYGASPHAGGFTHLPEREFLDSGYIFV